MRIFQKSFQSFLFEEKVVDRFPASNFYEPSFPQSSKGRYKNGSPKASLLDNVKKKIRKKLNSSSDIILKHLWQHREVAAVTFCWEDDVCQMNKKSMFKQNWFNVVDFLQSSYMKRDIKSRFEKSIFKCWISFLFSIVIVLRRNSLNVIGLMTECVKW